MPLCCSTDGERRRQSYWCLIAALGALFKPPSLIWLKSMIVMVMVNERWWGFVIVLLLA
jgi:hypothetical protein